MEKEFVFFTVFMVQRDKTIFTDNENKRTFRQALFIITGSSLEKLRSFTLESISIYMK